MLHCIICILYFYCIDADLRWSMIFSYFHMHFIDEPDIQYSSALHDKNFALQEPACRRPLPRHFVRRLEVAGTWLYDPWFSGMLFTNTSLRTCIVVSPTAFADTVSPALGSPICALPCLVLQPSVTCHLVRQNSVRLQSLRRRFFVDTWFADIGLPTLDLFRSFIWKFTTFQYRCIQHVKEIQ